LALPCPRCPLAVQVWHDIDGAPGVDDATRPSAERAQTANIRVCIVTASGQNVFFAELLDAIGDVLAAAGIRVGRSVNRFPPWHEDVVYLFVPHEYTPFVEREALPSAMHLSRSVVLCTEQPGTSWFEEGAAIAARAAMAMDINQLGVQELRRRGIEAELMQLGYFAGWDTWGGEDDGERPVDVTFMGGYTPRRARALARCGRSLARRNVELTMTEGLRPHLEGSTHFLSGERRWAALRRSKLIVNVHRGEVGYFEWLRVVGAMLNGCVVVSEHSLGFDPLIPGEHFVSVDYGRLAFAIDALLADHEWIATIRKAAYRLLRDELCLSTTIAPLVRAIERVAATPLEADLTIPVSVPPMPREPNLPPTEPERILTDHSGADGVRPTAKTLALAQVDLCQQANMENGSGDATLPDRLEYHGPRNQQTRVSILLTVQDNVDLASHTVASVAGSDFREYELIVIDDRSDDGSPASMRAELDRHPWLTWTVLVRGRGEGLSAARNRAIEHAHGELVFILEANNEIYPHALERLVAALDDDVSASFAYGIVEQFGPQGPRDLMGWHGWDPTRLRYGNYIGATAMIRRAAILDIGGYTLDARLCGWEDLALWCAFANRGLRGLRVPEILTRSPTEARSVIASTTDSAAAWSALVEQNAFLTA
jgi:hypothetical protein